jgi:hypothetical protein
MISTFATKSNYNGLTDRIKTCLKEGDKPTLRRIVDWYSELDEPENYVPLVAGSLLLGYVTQALETVLNRMPKTHPEFEAAGLTFYMSGMFDFAKAQLGAAGDLPAETRLVYGNAIMHSSNPNLEEVGDALMPILNESPEAQLMVGAMNYNVGDYSSAFTMIQLGFKNSRPGADAVLEKIRFISDPKATEWKEPEKKLVPPLLTLENGLQKPIYHLLRH